MADIDERDFFTDSELLVDPYAHMHALRAECPLRREPHHDVVMVTGYDEVVAIYNDTENFSSCTAVTGPFPGFPVPTDGLDDITDLIAEHRDSLPFSDQLPTMDPPTHTAHRHLLSRMITPKRLKENEEFISRIVDEQLDEALSADGRTEIISKFAGPVALLVVADLLGVPEEDHAEFREHMLGMKEAVGSTKGESLGHSPLEYLYEKFGGYIADRRANPTGDVLTGVAEATFPDGSTPEVIDAVRVASNLFAAGGETTVRLLSTAVMLIAEDADLQARLRAD
ncbi:MAG: cytochrome P450, partial [Acidimicrobiales bacterium]|nr:cytochrome P450 [Acidimicrobiales bacterium]